MFSELYKIDPKLTILNVKKKDLTYVSFKINSDGKIYIYNKTKCKKFKLDVRQLGFLSRETVVI